jgi:release factor glutamine methyltransferase
MDPYEPSADSFLLLKAAESWLEKNAKPGMRILDMGTGTGFIATNIARFLGNKGVKAALWASDIDTVRLPKNIKFIRSDLFGKIPGKFDLIVFNPPYLPASMHDKYLSKREKKQLIGGRKGNELALKFIEQLPHHLSPDGACLLLASSLSRPGEIADRAEGLGLRMETILEERHPFERLSVFLIGGPK